MAASMPQVNLSIGGHLMSSFGGMIRQSNLGLMALQKQAVRTNATLTNLGKGLVGATAGYLAIGSFTHFVTEAIKASKEEAGLMAALTGLITHQNALRGVGVQVSKAQVEAIKRQSEVLADQSGIFADVYERGAGILAQYKLTTAQIQSIQGGVANLLIYQRRMGKSAEDMQGTYDAIGKAVYSGVGKGLKSVGIELNAQQQTQLKQNALLHNYAASVRMINAEMRKQHGGDLAEFMKTLGGQASQGAVRMHQAVVQIGDAIRPISQLLSVAFGKVVPIFAPPIIKLAKMVSGSFQEWVKAIDQTLIPALRKMVNQGWNVVTKAIVWFKNNSGWFLPFLKNAVIGLGAWVFVIGPLVTAIGSLRLALMGLSLSNPFTALALSAGVAAYFVISRWGEVKKFFAGFWESIMGTKGANASLEPAGVMRAFGKGVTPKAGAVQLGWIGELKKAWGDFIGTMPEDVKKALANIQKDWTSLTTSVASDWKINVSPWLLPVWQDLIKLMGQIRDIYLKGFITSIDVVIKGVSNLLDVVVKVRDGFKDAFDWFSKLGGPSSPKGSQMPSHADPDPYGLHSKDRWKSGPPIDWLHQSGGSYNGPIRAGTYGPQSQGATSADARQIYGATLNGRKIRLGSDSAAISPNLVPQYPIGSWVDELDEKTGRVVRHKRVDDTSWFNAGHPTHNWVENYNDKDIGHVKLRKSPVQGPSSTDELNKAAPINISYNVTNHIHGGDITHQIAELHRKHIDQLHKDLTEVDYRRKRASLVSSSVS